MTTAREKAEQFYKERSSVALSASAARNARIFAFERGAAWQAGQPVEITDDMVERGALAMAGADDDLVADPHVVLEAYAGCVRLVLEAALGGEA